MIRVAAVGDVHVGTDSAGRLRPYLERLADEADLLLLVVKDPGRGDFGPWRFCGASLMPWSEVRLLPAAPSGLYEVCWKPRRAEGQLELVPMSGPYFDCGTPPDYLAANLESSGGKSVVGPGARVDGELVRSVVWPGGVVHRHERLVECIRVGEAMTVEARRS